MKHKIKIGIVVLIISISIFVKTQAPAQSEVVSVATSTIKESLQVATSTTKAIVKSSAKSGKSTQSTTTKPSVVNSSASTKEVYEYAKEVADIFYLDKDQFTKVMYCESGFNPNSINASDPYGGSKGAGQFLQKTFDHYKVLAGRPNGNIWNYKDALYVAGFMWNLDPSQNKQWSYYRILYGDLYYKYSSARESCDKKWIQFKNNL